MKITAIVLAAGSGSRMKSDVRKQYMEIKGKPLLLYALEAFEKSFIDDIILVLPEADIEHIKEEIIEPAGFSKIRAVVAGGSTRYHSVRLGLEAASEDTEAVFIHDGARPFIDDDILERAMNAVKEYGACVVGMPVKDTIKLADENGFAKTTVDRDKTWMIQTPQVFLYPEILELYEELARREEELIQKGINITDDAMVMEALGNRKVKLVEGSYDNIKITTPGDIALAESIIEMKNQS
ncbi:2-C-methyl-D-erythritol 4-phosphate cytidylyltransferase [Butyrivibrio sp. ob235]|uniref:2-C-methyl-D-erythritol 4-phosphate cytidylyltransferase n=1 Tax=Butyrivibrio sp. ob235 TaxID=1761780 RepID=UPI0008D7517F|nr:2-C-methyl-D-erythritol 4-phosphate cytidylyltransferase [Butyrivibrio sp. ob235]SEM49985.1 2-C-methyl-D-erythritol 4-phosphate cytidylyltransferase [Butyrivibrio sp. ob235]